MYEFEYMNKITEVLEKSYETNKDLIKDLAVKFAENIKTGHVIHTFGTGHSHMVGIELFARAGGLGNVDAMLDPDTLTAFGAQRSGAIEKLSGLADIIYDQYNIQKGDIMIITSNSGRNAVPIEMAMRCQKEGIYTIAVTNLEQSKNTTSRHPSGKRLFECVDAIIDTAGPTGDSMMTIGSIKILDAEGIKAPVLQSQNVDGFDNDAIYKAYEGKVKHF